MRILLAKTTIPLVTTEITIMIPTDDDATDKDDDATGNDGRDDDNTDI